MFGYLIRVQTNETTTCNYWNTLQWWLTINLHTYLSNEVCPQILYLIQCPIIILIDKYRNWKIPRQVGYLRDHGKKYYH